MGLIYKVFDDASFADDVAAFVKPFATGPAEAYRFIKQAFAKAESNGFAAQLQLEADLQRAAGRTADFEEALMAFAQKRAPVFRGR
jgi:2-(1,2-epoxy-1,2-dihydrophenyl)acetyl-CoA isomerase